MNPKVSYVDFWWEGATFVWYNRMMVQYEILRFPSWIIKSDFRSRIIKWVTFAKNVWARHHFLKGSSWSFDIQMAGMRLSHHHSCWVSLLPLLTGALLRRLLVALGWHVTPRHQIPNNPHIHLVKSWLCCKTPILTLQSFLPPICMVWSHVDMSWQSERGCLARTMNHRVFNGGVVGWGWGCVWAETDFMKGQVTHSQ